MEPQKRTLHPLLMAAAASVIVFSAVGVAAITGLLPSSKGSVKEETPVAATEAPAAQPAAAPAPATPAPVHKPVKKRMVHTAPKPLSAPAPVNYEPVAEAPQPAFEPQKPPVQPGLVGTVEAVREVTEDGKANGIGAVAGGAVGGVLGHQLSHDSKLVTLVGAAAGAFIGNEAQKRQNATKHWELTVRFDDGTTQTISSPSAPFWHQGDRVRLYEGKLQPV